MLLGWIVELKATPSHVVSPLDPENITIVNEKVLVSMITKNYDEY